MYLPYLTLVSAPRARKIPPPGYRDIPELAFEPDELAMLLRAARQAKLAGEPTLARDAESALRKLTHDVGLALGAVAGESEEHAARVTDAASAPSVTTLGDALLRRKRVRFEYHSINRDVTDARDVEPYGLFFVNGHWYLAARDVARDELRNFRVSRMRAIAINDRKPQSADYEIPRAFSLASHARTREPWEMGRDAPEEMVAEFRGESGATVAARALGAEVPGAPLRRRFQVRRVDSFARWLMSFAGEVVPVSPEHLCTQYEAIVAATLGAYSS